VFRSASLKEHREITSFCDLQAQFTLSLMVKSVLSIEPEEPRALKILDDFRTYMKGFVSLPLNFPGSSYSKAVKVSRVMLIVEITRCSVSMFCPYMS
jgi:cytochrome P450 family 724 subfamily B polypeptide 1